MLNCRPVVLKRKVVAVHEDLLNWRENFPILRKCVYLINNSLGAMPTRGCEDLTRYTEAWMTRGVRAWEDSWWQLPGKVGNQLAALIGAGSDQVSIQPNVTTAEWVAYSCLRPGKKRNKVVYSSLNFPSVRYFYQSRPELEISVVESEDGVSVPIEKVLDAIDDSTLAVPISHVIYKSSYIQDVESIIEKAHRVGAYVILDLYHSCGVIPVDVSKWNVDFAVGGVLKWLCGGPGVAFLYVRPDLAREVTPQLTGWLAHKRPFAFEPETDFTEGAYRFMSGTPNIPGLHVAQEGLRIISQVGVEKIRERSIALTELILKRARENGLEVFSPENPEKRGGHVSVDFEGSEEVSRKLLERDFVIDYRPGSGIRIAPHFYNSNEEVEALFDEISKLRR
jgi:kynureninase